MVRIKHEVPHDYYVVLGPDSSVDLLNVVEFRETLFGNLVFKRPGNQNSVVRKGQWVAWTCTGVSEPQLEEGGYEFEEEEDDGGEYSLRQ